jgi:hypothetical protein
MESANQLSTVETMAGMTREGNALAFPPLLQSLREFSEDFAWSEALSQDRMDEFIEWREDIANDSFEKANLHKSLDFWANDMDELERILNQYGRAPHYLLVDALNDPSLETIEFESLHNPSGRIVCNDVAYVIDNIDELVEDYPELARRWEEVELY